tara:strand:+ start:690 stop:1082 length:393 start_codon:yes stop_codon:yes gene_type:complete
MDEKKLNSLIDKIYESVLSPELREPLMQQLEKELGACISNWFIPHFEFGEYSQLVWTGDTSSQQDYLEHYIHIDPWHAHARQLPPMTSKLLTEEWNRKTLNKNECYNDFTIKRAGISSSAAIVLEKKEMS